MKINVISWTGKRNIGDESYKVSFAKTFPGQEFEFSDDGRFKTASEVAIVGGGDIFDEVFVRKLLTVPAKRYFALSVSAGTRAPLHQLHRFHQILVRDQSSVDFLTSQGIPCRYMPDLGFCLQGDVQRGQAFLTKRYAEEGLDLYQKRIGVVFNAYLYSGKTDQLARDHINFQKVAQDLARVLDETHASFIFIPMSTGMPQDDRVTNGYLANKCKFWKKNFVVFERLSVQETLDLIAACDGMVSSRLHSTIFSISNQIPFLDITHHDKNRSVLKTIGLEKQSLSYWNFDSEIFKSSLKSILNNGSVYKTELKKIHEQQLGILRKEASYVRFGQ